jgi:hypothetical protein
LQPEASIRHSAGWYLIPAALIVRPDHISDAMLCPVGPPVKKASYRYECYREAWRLLTRSRTELAKCNFTASCH